MLKHLQIERRPHVEQIKEQVVPINVRHILLFVPAMPLHWWQIPWCLIRSVAVVLINPVIVIIITKFVPLYPLSNTDTLDRLHLFGASQ